MAIEEVKVHGYCSRSRAHISQEFSIEIPDKEADAILSSKYIRSLVVPHC